MDAETNLSVMQLLDRWQAEDHELEEQIDELRDWMQEVSQLGIPHFGETASRLLPLRKRLAQHFEREQEMIGELVEADSASSPEMDGVRRNSTHDHSQLLSRADDLIARLNQTDPPFDSWQAAMDEVAILAEALEQHEENEMESIRMLLSIDPDSGAMP